MTYIQAHGTHTSQNMWEMSHTVWEKTHGGHGNQGKGKRNNSRYSGNTHTQVMRQHKWLHPVMPCNARLQGIQWSHVMQGHMTWGKVKVMEIVSLKQYVKL